MNYYLDDSASTRVNDHVLKAMLPWFSRDYGNPSSLHDFGLKARKKLDEVRTEIARKIGAKAHEIIFTSGVTESNNLALQGLARINNKRKIVISSIEHASINEICIYLQRQGYTIVRIPVHEDGTVQLDILEKSIDDRTLLVSISHANNVIGTVQDITAIGRLCHRKNVVFHTDASQTFNRIHLNVRDSQVTMLSGSGHKMGGPKGSGFLFIREGIRLEPLIYGGGQERGLRGGTENVPAIVGLGAALEIKINSAEIRKTRDALITLLAKEGGIINGSLVKRLDNNIHISFPGKNAEMIVARLSHQGIYISRGSACDSKKDKEDHVLRAIGLDTLLIDGSIRITLARKLSLKEINYLVKKIMKAVTSS
jgi:cysteine desulfurase